MKNPKKIEKWFKRKIKRKSKKSEGQANTEYILILATAVILFTLVVKRAIKPMFSLLTTRVVNQMENKFINGDLHSISVKRPR